MWNTRDLNKEAKGHYVYKSGLIILGRRTRTDESTGVQYITFDLGLFSDFGDRGYEMGLLVRNKTDYFSQISRYGQSDLYGYRSGKPCFKHNDETDDLDRDRLVNSSTLLIF